MMLMMMTMMKTFAYLNSAIRKTVDRSVVGGWTGVRQSTPRRRLLPDRRARRRRTEGIAVTQVLRACADGSRPDGGRRRGEGGGRFELVPPLVVTVTAADGVVLNDCGSDGFEVDGGAGAAVQWRGW